MSFDIPIHFEDSPFNFERDSLFQRRPRNTRFTRDEKEPGSFQTRTKPKRFFEVPREESHYRPNYRNAGRRGEFTEQPKESEHRVTSQQKAQNRSRISNIVREGSEDEDIYDPEDPRGANVDTGGWDIPVQFVEAPATRDRHRQHDHGHRHQQKPQCTTNKAVNKEFQTGDQRQGRGITDKVVKEVRVDHEETEKGDEDDTAEHVKAPKGQKKETNSMTKDLGNKKGKGSESYEDIKDENGIPVQRSSHEEKPKRNSRRLSQCEPPSAAEIKLTRIKSIVNKSEDLENKIKGFNDPVQNKAYLYISESLMRLLLDFDCVDSEGIDAVRKARKGGVQTVQYLVHELENKLAENKKNAATAPE